MKWFLIGCTLFNVSNSQAQTPIWDWAVSIGGPGNEYCYSLASDVAGNIYATGYFAGNLDFDPGPAANYMNAGQSTGIYLAKFDNNGSLLWVRGIMGPGYKAGGHVVIDVYDNVYLCGIFSGYLAFETGSSPFGLTSPGITAAYVSKFTSTGSFVWAKTVGGSDHANGATMAIGGSGTGSVYLAGNFSGVVDFDPDTTVVEMTAAGISDTYIMKLDTSGSFIWARSIGGTD
ncbi:MAG: hypothetical protein M3R08_04310, partial [Bacteroidota bacterium]|nr:hypothetical protein [Bacteroidota bacterium]